jgi:hypothetical protein
MAPGSRANRANIAGICADPNDFVPDRPIRHDRLGNEEFPKARLRAVAGGGDEHGRGAVK